jgi:hypothetical protein
MLVSHPAILKTDLILKLVAEVNGRTRPSQELVTGIYEIPHFGSSDWPQGVKRDEHNFINAKRGVCDSWEQVVEHHRLGEDIRKFVVTLTPIDRATEPPSGGWRWHKWGPYIGTQKPQCEYLYDEPLITRVYVYAVYEVE